jgi:hypothetical protein
MKLVETFNEMIIPKDFYMDVTTELKRTEYSDYEYVLHVWSKLFRKYMSIVETG